MASTKDELLASTIRKQIAYLEGLLQEMEDGQDKTQAVMDRIQQVEAKLHKLRGGLTL